MLEIKFTRIENSIVMKVLEQGEEIERGNFSFTASNDITIKSTNNPQMENNNLFVRGINTTPDAVTSSIDFPSVNFAKIYLKKYIEAIKEYNSLVKPKNEEEMDDCETITVF